MNEKEELSNRKVSQDEKKDFKENNESIKETENKTTQEVSSIKLSLFGNVVTFTSKKEISNVVGEKLSGKQAKDNLLTSVYSDKAIEDLVDNIKENGEKEKEEGKDKKKEFNKKRIIPIALVLMVPLLLKSCQTTEVVKEANVVTYEKEVDMNIYSIDNPYSQLEGIVGVAGQEEMTANLRNGDTFEGKYYSSKEHLQAETNAISGLSIFETLEENINLNIKSLMDQNTSQMEKQQAAQNLLELEQQAQAIYQENQAFAEEYVQRFAEASESYRDINTDNEIAGTNSMFDKYLEQLGLSSANVTGLQEIVKLTNEGYDLEMLTGEQELDGDYHITGKAIKEVVEEQDIEKSISLWQKITDFVKGDRGQER